MFGWSPASMRRVSFCGDATERPVVTLPQRFSTAASHHAQRSGGFDAGSRDAANLANWRRTRQQLNGQCHACQWNGETLTLLVYYHAESRGQAYCRRINLLLSGRRGP